MKNMKRKPDVVIPSTLFGEKRRRQALHTTDTFEKLKKEVDCDLLKKVDEEQFDTTLKCLIQKWTGKNSAIGDCGGTRLVNEFIKKKLNDPMTVFIIADDKNHFFELLKNSEAQGISLPLSDLVSFACTSGAISIVSELLQNEKVMSQCSENLIAYAVSSGNKDLALNVATFFRSKGADDPGMIHLYSFGKNSLVKKIEALFTDNTANDTPIPH